MVWPVWRSGAAVLVALVFLVCPSVSIAQVKAFPGAEGFGANSVGGRGGAVIEVTNLNDSGTGSLRTAVSTTGARTVVFRVSGTIVLNSRLNISRSNLTIAGQTAPGGGITLRDYGLSSSASDVIVRFIRSRLGDVRDQEDDAIWISSGHNVIFDHCSASWSVDETFSCSSGGGTGPSSPALNNVTVQWCMITESLNHSIHGKGDHGYGSLIRGSYGARYTYHHNYYCHHKGRSPRPGNYNGLPEDPNGLLFDFRNNVIYNWGGHYAGYNMDGDDASYDKNTFMNMNYVGNYLELGTNSTLGYAFSEDSLNDWAYFAGNFYNGAYPSDPYSLVLFPTAPPKSVWSPTKIAAYKATPEFAVDPVQTDDAVTAFGRVQDFAGAVFPYRDSVDRRLLADVVNGTGQIIDTPSQVGGWPTLSYGTPPADNDHDGMADDWETTHGLNPADPADRNADRNGDGYTNLEEYLNWLVRPNVSVEAYDSGAWEATGDPAVFVVERTGYTDFPLTVNFSVGGTATPGVDYRPLPASVTIPVGALRAYVYVVPYTDGETESTESVTLVLAPSEDDFRLATQVGASVKILDASTPTSARDWTMY